MSKVTSRTLRHYDAIGLLKPADVGANGYRYYVPASNATDGNQLQLWTCNDGAGAQSWF